MKWQRQQQSLAAVAGEGEAEAAAAVQATEEAGRETGDKSCGVQDDKG
jgi:hypothetical protein